MSIQKEFCAQITDSAFDEIYIFEVESLSIVEVNKGAISNVGYSESELLELSFLNLVTDFNDEEFRETVEPLIREEKELLVFETHIQRNDETSYPVEVRLQAACVNERNFFIAVIMDVTERKTTVMALKEREDYLRAIFEATPECVAIVGENGIVFDINSTGLDILGVKSKDSLIEQDFCNFAHGKDQENLRNVFNNALFNRETSSVEYQATTDDGREVYFGTRAVPLYDSDNNAVATLAVTHDMTERKKAELEIEHLAFHDPLTELYNRRSFDEKIKQTVAEYKRAEHAFGLMVVDLDDFSVINNTLGHQAGDDLLVQMSQRLKDFFKRDTDFVARFGGDEFVVIITGLKDEVAHVMDEYKVRGKRLVEHMGQPYTLDNQKITITTSIGMSLCMTSPASITVDEVLQRSDNAMYRAKHAGKNSFTIHPVT